LKEFLIGSKRIFEEQSGNSVSKNCPGLVFIFLGDLKNRWGPGLRKPKRSSYDEVRARVRVCD